ncbi:MAG: hypothetical protein ACOC6C_04645 [Verrucomicrobiota bacterium]
MINKKYFLPAAVIFAGVLAAVVLLILPERSAEQGSTTKDTVSRS